MRLRSKMWTGWMGEWSGYPLDCYDYQSTCGATKHEICYRCILENIIFGIFKTGAPSPAFRPTEILMLIAGEVGTKSKWAIPRELYFQMVPNGSQQTFTFLFLLQTQNHKYPCTVAEMPLFSPSRVYFNILSKIGIVFFSHHPFYLCSLQRQGKFG